MAADRPVSYFLPMGNTGFFERWLWRSSGSAPTSPSLDFVGFAKTQRPTSADPGFLTLAIGQQRILRVVFGGDDGGEQNVPRADILMLQQHGERGFRLRESYFSAIGR